MRLDAHAAPCIFWALATWLRYNFGTPYSGGVAEWLNAAVSKTVYPVLPGTRVRIPPPPPDITGSKHE